jgi:hypothetical protein
MKLLRTLLVLTLPLATFAAEPVQVSGIYPQLAMFNKEGECGTGAVVPWADRLWVITYGPHLPFGSSDKLYEITPGLEQIIRPESVGGTPANRMIHRESQQLIIGPYFIDAQRQVRAIPPALMPGRLTGVARHLIDPAGKVYFATMEEGLYEVDVKTLDVVGLIKDGNKPPAGKTNQAHPATVASQLPGYHGKGLYSGQGRVIYANNGEDKDKRALSDPTTPSGALAEWRKLGDDWQLVRRNQFTEVTGPGGIHGNEKPETDPVWSIGWDAKSLILMLLDHGQWQSFRLPKASHSYDGAHGWNTEWPRIRDIGEDALLMTMHGTFWKFPKTFSAANSAGIAPRSNYLKVIGDFARWQDRVVFGCDDTAKSEFLNKRKAKGDLAGPGQSQSNLWFVPPAKIDQLGPVIGSGAVWLEEPVKAGAASDAYLFSGYAHRLLSISQDSAEPVTFAIEVDAKGTGDWKPLRSIEVPAHGSAWTPFPASEVGTWVRLKSNRDAEKVTASFHYRNDDPRTAEAAPIFAGLAQPNDSKVSGGLIYARGADLKTLRFVASNPAGEIGCYDLDGDLKLRRVEDADGVAYARKNYAIPQNVLTVEDASMLYVDPKGRWRLPKGDAAFDKAGPLGDERISREVCTERDLFNAAGTFFELPAENAGGFAKIRPVTTHNRRIKDYCSYRGLLVLSGVTDGAQGEHIVRSDDGKCALWVGAVDDLWQFGKPRGEGGPWKNTAVQPGQPSDAFLIAGYDRKHMMLSHDAKSTVDFTIEVDFLGTGAWSEYQKFSVTAAAPTTHDFPAGFEACWVRVKASQSCQATAIFKYD